MKRNDKDFENSFSDERGRGEGKENETYPRTPIRNGTALISVVLRLFQIFTQIGLKFNKMTSNNSTKGCYQTEHEIVEKVFEILNEK